TGTSYPKAKHSCSPVPSRYVQKRHNLSRTIKGPLRFRPDRIILGEVRGIEARTLLDSLNTGHTGSLATIHANSEERWRLRWRFAVGRLLEDGPSQDCSA